MVLHFLKFVHQAFGLNLGDSFSTKAFYILRNQIDKVFNFHSKLLQLFFLFLFKRYLEIIFH